MLHKHTNSLINETSPYLLQHAHNPVNWVAWNNEALEKAKKENKLILISVGYSACHWCHVMEHESFEDETVAKIMNDYFVCIKVDREERPDIDQIYMLAVQLMTGHGGWPLNCFTLPDLRPIYGGTYFKKSAWINILLNLVDLQKEQPEKLDEYATQLMQGMKVADTINPNKETENLNSQIIFNCYNNWKTRFDNVDGGPDKAPKFPLPNNYLFLLRLCCSSILSKDENKILSNHIELTLKKMAYGGIYDQIGGGFARYSVDHYWKVPHFEKMLYDNAQLISLYSEAFRVFKNPLYKNVVYETIAFIERELSAPKGGFYSALDADSEGAEGKYYVWTKEELKQLLKNDFDLLADYYNVNKLGLWEHDNYILLRNAEDIDIAEKHGITIEALEIKINSIKKLLLNEREKRIKPGLDNKILTSWNALMISALIDASIAFNEPQFLNLAQKNIDFLLENALLNKNELAHCVNGKEKIGFLEDYSFLIEALIAFYQATFQEKYLSKAYELMNACFEKFVDKATGMFYFTSTTQTDLISRKMELSDNVIPASNSSMAKSLFYLGHFYERTDYIEQSKQMLQHVIKEMEHYGAGYSNWGILALHNLQPFYEVAIVGKTVDEKKKSIDKYYFPNMIFAGSNSESTLPLLKNRYKKDETYIYVCSNNTCKEPIKTIEEMLLQLKS